MQVVASTAVLMILFSSSSIALSLAFDHLLNVHYALVYGPLAFVSSLFGVIVLGRIVRRTGLCSNSAPVQCGPAGHLQILCRGTCLVSWQGGTPSGVWLCVV